MSSFTMVMMEEGVEVELPTDLTELVSILDKEVPGFSCNGYGYSVIAGKGTLGRNWELMIKSVDLSSPEAPPVSLGRIELQKIDAEFVRLRIPPRFGQDLPEADEFDPDGKILGSFMFHTLNTLQQHELMDLPGVLPTV
jgi:hypothetical protein